MRTVATHQPTISSGKLPQFWLWPVVEGHPDHRREVRARPETTVHPPTSCSSSLDAKRASVLPTSRRKQASPIKMDHGDEEEEPRSDQNPTTMTMMTMTTMTTEESEKGGRSSSATATATAAVVVVS